jgi:hypothetical protein
MGLTSFLNNPEPQGLSPEQAARYEAIYLSRRARDSRRHRERRVTEAEYLAEIEGGHGAQGEPATGRTEAVETPAPEPPPRPPKRVVTVERRESLRDMAARLTGKGRRVTSSGRGLPARGLSGRVREGKRCEGQERVTK